MMTLLIHLLHIFIIMMFTLVAVFGFLAINGTFDNWTQRFKAKKREPENRHLEKRPYTW